MDKVLLIFPGISVNSTSGAKHRLNSYIDAYYENGFAVSVLAFFKDNPFCKSKELNPNGKWFLLPYILPMTKHPLVTSILLLYLKTLVAIISWFTSASIIQMEMYSLRSKMCNPRKKYITDIHGDSLSEFVEMGRGDINHWYAKRLLNIQKKTIKNSDRILCVSENLKKQLEINTSMKIRNYRIISCGVNLERFNVPKATLPIDLTNRIVIGYSGALQKWQCIEDVIKIATFLSQKDMHVFLIIFTMDSLEPYKNLLEGLGEENYYSCSLKTDDVPSYLKLLDAGFLVRDNLVLNKVASPTKTPEYLAAGAGLICTAYAGDFEVYTKDRGNCFVLRDDRYGDIDDMLIWLKRIKEKKPDNSFLKQYSFQEQFNRSNIFFFDEL